VAETLARVPIVGRVDQPVHGEKSRTKPDQVGNIAGATGAELAERLLQTSRGYERQGVVKKVHVFWMAGMACDGCSIATLGAVEPSVEELITGSIPGIPLLVLHHYVLSLESGDHFTHSLEEAERGDLDGPFVIVYEGSIPDEHLTINGEPWAAEGALPTWAPAEERERVSTAEWVRRLSSRAAAVIAIGTCATWGGIPGADGNPTGAMSVMDFLGKEYRSAYGLPVINVPGCAPVGDNFTETVALVLLFLNGLAPLPEFDEVGRPAWLFDETVHRHCPRAGWYEEGTFAKEYGDKECVVEIGCWGPVVNCNITERGAEGHMGGCMVAGGVCIGCTMPGFPDKFTPFYKRPPGSRMSGSMSRTVGAIVRPLRRATQLERNREPRWIDKVPSGWALEYDRTSLSHRILEYFYEKLQYFMSERPGRQKDVEKYRSGYVTPLEAAYGEHYQQLPEERAKLAKERGSPRRPSLEPPESSETPTKTG
jgi:hydrogenase small subunit